MTNSLRGYFDFDVIIETLQQESHYGPEASGIIAENLFLVRKLYDGIIDSTNGEFKLDEFKVEQFLCLHKGNKKATQGLFFI